MHVAVLHPRLDVSDASERLLASVKAAKAAGWRVSVLTARGALARAFEAAGAELYEAELPLEPWLGWFAERRTTVLLGELEPDLLHATEGLLAPLAGRLAERLELPYLVEVMQPNAALRLAPTRWMRALVVPCETFVEGVVNRGGAHRALVEVQPHRPCLDRPWTPRPLGEVARPVVATLGTLDDLHGTEVFLEAARRLKAKGRKLSYLVLGEGPNEGRLRQRVREHDLGEEVTVAAPALPDFGRALSQIDVHVSCVSAGSPGWCAVQALGLGVPSVLSAVSCTFALVEDRKSGLLVERNRPDKLVEQLEVLLDNPQAARRMGDVARQSMRQRELARPHGRAQVELYERAARTAPLAATS
ncbi:MAG: glycosyltransferase family 4 protein [Planctomycetes bacterium]|nr:glycosyltransferase family 4 protein [Planctomycetota bacterium]